MNASQIIDVLVDLAPFAMYTAVLIKLYRSWRTVKSDVPDVHRSRLAAVMTLLAVVIGCFLAANVYALAVYGKTYLSLHVFQLFIMGNCVVYWLVIDLLTKDAVTIQGNASESANRIG